MKKSIINITDYAVKLLSDEENAFPNRLQLLKDTVKSVLRYRSEAKRYMDAGDLQKYSELMYQIISLEAVIVDEIALHFNLNNDDKAA